MADGVEQFSHSFSLHFRAALEEDPLLRMKLILKWYLSGFYKKPKGLKKPYNPILGETFRCCWQHPETDSKTFYIAEQVCFTLLVKLFVMFTIVFLLQTQVSHHPPVSAFYVTNRKDGFCISGSILAKSKFYGNGQRFPSHICRFSLIKTCTTRQLHFGNPRGHGQAVVVGPRRGLPDHLSLRPLQGHLPRTAGL